MITGIDSLSKSTVAVGDDKKSIVWNVGRKFATTKLNPVLQCTVRFAEPMNAIFNKEFLEHVFMNVRAFVLLLIAVVI